MVVLFTGWIFFSSDAQPHTDMFNYLKSINTHLYFFFIVKSSCFPKLNKEPELNNEYFKCADTYLSMILPFKNIRS